jgi:hypothetical protein
MPTIWLSYARLSDKKQWFLRDSAMLNTLAFFQVGQLGFYLLILSLIAVVIFYVLYRKQQG